MVRQPRVLTITDHIFQDFCCQKWKDFVSVFEASLSSVAVWFKFIS